MTTKGQAMTQEEREHWIRYCAEWAASQVIAAAENIGSEESSFEIPDPTDEEKRKVIEIVVERLNEHLARKNIVIIVEASWPAGTVRLPGCPEYHMIIRVDSRFTPLPADKALHDELRTVLTKYGARNIRFTEKIMCSYNLKRPAAMRQAVIDVLKRYYVKVKQ